MTLRLINPRKDRHDKASKALISKVCDGIESINGETAGFALVVWDDIGRSSSYIQAGGCISTFALPAHVTAQVNLHLTSFALEKVNDASY